MKPEIQKNILYILIPSSILVVLWIASSVYNRAVTSTITQSQNKAIVMISGSFDTAAFSNLQKRSSITPDFSLATQAVPASLSATPTPIPTLIDDTNSSESGGTL